MATYILCAAIGCCNRRHYKKTGFCPKHQRKWEKYGSPTFVHERYRINERWIDEHANYQGDDCLIWPFHRGENGRGVIGRPPKRMSAPRAMCIAAHGEPPTPEHEARHSCGNGHLGCMSPRHLSWGTHMENVIDRAEHGRDRKGTEINTAKLDEARVLEIRKATNVKGVALAKQYGVSTTTISEIRKRKSWKWLE